MTGADPRRSRLSGPARVFDPDQASGIGIIIVDDGNFALDVDWIDACR